MDSRLGDLPFVIGEDMKCRKKHVFILEKCKEMLNFALEKCKKQGVFFLEKCKQ